MSVTLHSVGVRLTLGVLAAAAVACAATARVPVEPRYEAFAIRYATLPNFRVSGLIAGADTSRRLDIAMMVWMLRGANRTIVIDAGFQRPDLIQRWRPTGYVKPSEAVAAAGVAAEQVTDVIISHIHWDHFDGVELFPNATIWIQREEVWHHIDSTGKVLDRAIDAPDAQMLARLIKQGRVKLVDGDQEIIPGINVWIGGKHTFQSQFTPSSRSSSRRRRPRGLSSSRRTTRTSTRTSTSGCPSRRRSTRHRTSARRIACSRWQPSDASSSPGTTRTS
jgi:hypothetical protein